jgi:hypothetical protein
MEPPIRDLWQTCRWQLIDTASQLKAIANCTGNPDRERAEEAAELVKQAIAILAEHTS